MPKALSALWGLEQEKEGFFMSIKMKELPISERPYEKLELYGEKYLSNAELLAIIIKTGTRYETAISLAQKVLKLKDTSSKDGLSFLVDIPIEEFMKIKGIGKVKSIQLKALCELAKRISKPINSHQIIVKNNEDIAQLFMAELRHEKREIAKVVILNNKNVILKIIDISIRRSKFCLYRTKRCVNRSNKNTVHQE